MKKELKITTSAEEGLEQAILGFEKFMESNRKNRAKRWSAHYLDTQIKFNKAHTHYLTRAKQGSGVYQINKVNKHDSPPELSSHDTLLGRIEMTFNNETPVLRFYPSNPKLESKELPYNKLVDIPELGISLWRKGKEKNIRVRVHNYERPFAEQFSHPQFYQYNPLFRVETLYTAYPEPLSVDVNNSNNGIDEGELRHGFIEFIMKGKYHKLFVYDNEQIRFTDISKGAYPGGRYLLPEEGDLEKRVFFLDFNRSYDPPCAFSQAYVCSLPTYEEHIDQAVEAGRIYPLNFVSEQE